MLNFAFQDAMAKGVDPMWAKSEGQGQTGPLVGSGDDEDLQETDWDNQKKLWITDSYELKKYL